MTIVHLVYDDSPDKRIKFHLPVGKQSPDQTGLTEWSYHTACGRHIPDSVVVSHVCYDINIPSNIDQFGVGMLCQSCKRTYAWNRRIGETR